MRSPLFFLADVGRRTGPFAGAVETGCRDAFLRVLSCCTGKSPAAARAQRGTVPAPAGSPAAAACGSACTDGDRAENFADVSQKKQLTFLPTLRIMINVKRLTV